MKICKVKGCQDVVQAKGMCPVHYQRVRQGRDLLAPVIKRVGGLCSIAKCGRDILANGLCIAHYERSRKGQDMGPPILERNPNRKCLEPGCGGEYYAKNKCQSHYCSFYERTPERVSSRKKRDGSEARKANKRSWNQSVHGKEVKREWYKRKSSEDPNYKLARLLRHRLYLALRPSDTAKRVSAVLSLGCSIAYFRVYLEGLFQPGMTWENQGKWHIDHIRPMSSFDLTDPEQQKAACHYTNLQPLWAEDNLKKWAHYG